MNCQNFKNDMPELLIDARSAVSVAARAHLDGCAPCRTEFASFQRTFGLLDEWKAPEPSAYFDQKLAVRLREEMAAPAASWWERMESRLLFNTGRQFRPMMAGAFALVLLLGGGTFAGISTLPGHRDAGQVSATVGDLQILDKNDQALQQMDQFDQLLQDDQTGDDSSNIQPRS